MNPRPRPLSGLLAAFSLMLFSGPARAASYLPLSDAELALRAPVIVRALVLGGETRLRTEGTSEVVTTVTRFSTREVFKGSVPETFTIELPGGSFGEISSWFPGTPVFTPGGEALLFLAPSGSDPDCFGLTEFGLSKFDLVQDRAGQEFAVRPVFGPEEDDLLSGRDASIRATGARHAFREAGSFSSALRFAGAGGELPPVLYGEPDGEPHAPATAVPAWVNIGGTEGTNRLYRWFWDTGRSPAARVTAAGTQSGLTDGSDGVSSVENAARGWSSVPGASVRYSSTDGSAQVVVNLDVASHSSSWSAPLACGSGGIIGLGGPNAASSAGAFRGDGNYSAATSGNVWMRKVTGGCYDGRTFRSAVLHELGHTLGLGHPDQATSIHSTTTAAEWSSAVMVSSVSPSAPSTPQADDIAAILWLYGSGASAAPPPNRPRPDLSERRPRLPAPAAEIRP